MKKSFVLYLDQYTSIKKLSNEQAGMLLKAMFEFNLGNDFEITDPVVDMAFSFLGETFKRDSDKYLKICEKNKKNARIRWDKKNATASDRISKNAKHADSDKIVIVKEDSDSDMIVIDKTQIEFDSFWMTYDKKTDKSKCMKKWKLLKQSERDLILNCVFNYAESTPDPQYRKNPLTWLNGKCWNDEIIIKLNPAEQRLQSNIEVSRRFLDE